MTQATLALPEEERLTVEVRDPNGQQQVRFDGVRRSATVHEIVARAVSELRLPPPHLAESVLLPSKQVSPVFRASCVATTGGQVFTGLVVAETGDKLELLLSDTTRKTIARADVAERKLLDTSPMPQGLVKTPAELRDLLAYLFSDNPQAP